MSIEAITPDVMKFASLAGGYAAMGFAAIGSAIGTGYAGAAAIGAWKKCYQQDKPAPFLLMALVGAPLSQSIYGMLLMLQIQKAAITPAQMPLYLMIGIIGGIAMGISALFQGKAAAGGCVSFAETGKGFANTLMALGVIETSAIFALIFSLMAMPK